MALSQSTLIKLLVPIASAAIGAGSTLWAMGHNAVTKDDLNQAIVKVQEASKAEINNSFQVVNQRIQVLESGSLGTASKIEQIQRDVSDQRSTTSRTEAKVDILLQHSRESK